MDDDDLEPPKLTLAASNDPQEVDAKREWERCLWHVEHNTRELAGNMLRIIRGAGRPYQLMDQIIALYREMENAPPGITCGAVTETMEDALRSGRRDPNRSTFGDDLCDIEAGALRAVAGRILHQQLQESAGDRELWDGYYRLERGREENRKRWRAEAAASRLPRSKKARVKLARKIVAAPPKPPESEPEMQDRPKSTAEFMKRRAAELAKAKD